MRPRFFDSPAAAWNSRVTVQTPVESVTVNTIVTVPAGTSWLRTGLVSTARPLIDIAEDGVLPTVMRAGAGATDDAGAEAGELGCLALAVESAGRDGWREVGSEARRCSGDGGFGITAGDVVLPASRSVAPDGGVETGTGSAPDADG